MKRLERLGEAKAPDGTVLTLLRRDGAYAIRAGGVELMSTRRYHSEEQLAELACSALERDAAPRVLVGGLGFGFTLRAALRVLPPGADVVVAEIVAGIIEWNRHPEYPLAGPALDDPRVELLHDDVAAVMGARPGAFDAIMLDVDNGAEALTTGANAGLYAATGVRLAARALRPGGLVAYWSADDDPAFVSRLRGAGLEVRTVRARAHATSGSTHTLILARKPAANGRGR